MATRERWIAGAVEERGVPLEQATAVVDHICETDGGGPLWIPTLPDDDARARRDEKILALWAGGKKTSDIAKRLGLTQRQVQKIIKVGLSR